MRPVPSRGFNLPTTRSRKKGGPGLGRNPAFGPPWRSIFSPSGPNARGWGHTRQEKGKAFELPRSFVADGVEAHAVLPPDLLFRFGLARPRKLNAVSLCPLSPLRIRRAAVGVSSASLSGGPSVFLECEPSVGRKGRMRRSASKTLWWTASWGPPACLPRARRCTLQVHLTSSLDLNPAALHMISAPIHPRGGKYANHDRK